MHSPLNVKFWLSSYPLTLNIRDSNWFFSLTHGRFAGSVAVICVAFGANMLTGI